MKARLTRTKKPSGSDAAFEGKLRELRARIDQADREMIRALAKRFLAVRHIGILKKKNRLPIQQKSRWKQLLVDRRKLVKKAGLSSALGAKIFELIHGESLFVQRRVTTAKKKKRAR